MAEPMVIYGLGAAKAGSSTLYSWLHDHPRSGLRSIKELHYFDTVGVPKQREFYIKTLIKRRALHLDRSEAFRRAEQMDRAANQKRIINDIDDLIEIYDDEGDHFAAYRRYMLAARRDGDFVADITPAYAMLDASDIQKMAQSFDTVKFIYLLRDPVERLWSHVRMMETRAGRGRAGAANAAMRDAISAADEGLALARSDYAATLAMLKSALPEEQVFVDFFEDVFTESGIERLSAFLGIEPCPLATSQKQNEGKEFPLQPALRARAARLLAPQYDYVAGLLGDLPAVWQENMKRIPA